MIATDTICALATPPGIGGLAVVRISGPEAISIADLCFKGKFILKNADSHTIHYGKFYDDDIFIDTVTASVFKNPHSYTGENTIEFGCHGGHVISQNIINALLKNGARYAEPGEFTKLAFLNGKLDLTQVEAVADIIHAQSTPASFISARQLAGGLSKRFEDLLQKLIKITSLLELELDFSEEDVEFVDKAQLLKDLEEVLKFCRELSDSYRSSQILRSGFFVTLVGYPNSGKSSLFNKLINRTRSIVSDIPGTTRDYLEESLVRDGISFKIHDTAGVRETEDTIELQGIEFIESLILQSNLVLVINDSSIDPTSSINFLKELKQKYPHSEYVYIHNKTDLIPNGIIFGNDKILSFKTSIYDGNSINEVLKHISASAKLAMGNQQFGLINERHAHLLEKIASHITLSIDSLKNKQSNEFIAFDLHQAISLIGEITGKTYSEDVLNSIFSGFCIGR
ncbi:MAG: tRNA uridine-5-carboxymethylaminomethyl(34) synthesis GTPase MnmE [Bacteroidota bacterium]